MKRAVSIAWLVVLFVGCSNPPDETARSQADQPDADQARSAPRSQQDLPPEEPEQAEPNGSPQQTMPPQAESREPERQVVVDARLAAEQAKADSLNPPDPDRRGLRDTHAGTALERARYQADIDARNATTTRHPSDSKHDLVVVSVTFPSDDVAWIETCVNDDSQRFVGKQLSVFSEGPRTLQLTEEMRKTDGVWQLTQSFVNRYREGIKPCPSRQAYEEQALDAELEQTITRAREQAEQAFVDWLVDGDKAADLHTGFFRRFFSDDPGNTLQFYCSIGVGQRRASPKCLDRYERGTNAPAFITHSDGAVFDRSSRATVTVRSITLQSVEQPKVAYLRTCRLYRFKRRDGGGLAAPRGLVENVEAMHLEGGTWKLSNRWNLQVQEYASGGCD